MSLQGPVSHVMPLFWAETSGAPGILYGENLQGRKGGPGCCVPASLFTTLPPYSTHPTTHTHTRAHTHTHTHTHWRSYLQFTQQFQAQAHCLALGHPEGRGSGKNLMEVVYSEGDSRRQTCGVGRVTQGKSQDECMFP